MREARTALLVVMAAALAACGGPTPGVPASGWRIQAAALEGGGEGGEVVIEEVTPSTAPEKPDESPSPGVVDGGEEPRELEEPWPGDPYEPVGGTWDGGGLDGEPVPIEAPWPGGEPEVYATMQETATAPRNHVPCKATPKPPGWYGAACTIKVDTPLFAAGAPADAQPAFGLQLAAARVADPRCPGAGTFLLRTLTGDTPEVLRGVVTRLEARDAGWWVVGTAAREIGGKAVGSGAWELQLVKEQLPDGSVRARVARFVVLGAPVAVDTARWFRVACAPWAKATAVPM